MRKLVIAAAVDGLIVHSVAQRNQRPLDGIKIKYLSNEITSSKEEHGKSWESINSYGIVGILTVGLSSYLISISSRQQVAVIFAKPIYVITGVTFIPLSSQAAVKKTFEQEASKKRSSHANTNIDSTDSEVSDEEEEPYANSRPRPTENDESPTSEPAEGRAASLRVPGHMDNSVAEDVFGRKGQYGRFAEKWFSRKGWTSDKRRNQGMSTEVVPIENDSQAPRTDNGQDGTDTKGVSQGQSEQIGKQEDISKRENNQSSRPNDAETLLPKLLQTTKVLLSSQSFYFSYDYDITRRLGTDEVKNRDLPLYKMVDPMVNLTSGYIDDEPLLKIE